MITLDFLIRQSYYVQHLAPIWHALPKERRGRVYVLPGCIPEVQKYIPLEDIQEYPDGGECGKGYILTASFGDALRPARKNPSRPVILMEHGIGFTFGNSAYADGAGQRNRISHFLYPNQYTANKVQPELRERPSAVIGVPKMDKWEKVFSTSKPIMPAKPTIGIAFHHGDKNATPGVVGSAWEHYAEILPALAREYKLLLHAHPIIRDDSPLHELYKTLNAEYVSDFEEIMRRADIYINDASSTAYEFLVTGKPVILLNAPWFLKEQYGIRFWDYADIGEQVNEPSELLHAVERTMAMPERFQAQAGHAITDLFPFLGSASQKAVAALTSFMDGTYVKNPEPTPAPPVSASPLKPKVILPPVLHPHPPVRQNLERGILYMCFGEKARHEMEKSIISLRNVGCTLPVFVVANGMPDLNGLSGEVHGIHTWSGQSPYDETKPSHFQFRAGRVKPAFYRLSPFQETLYVDVDTEFMINPEVGFGFLKHWDFAIAQERLSIGELYNGRGKGWEHNLHERDLTIAEFGGDGHFPFINSGVFFWRKSPDVEELFDLWLKEWERFQNWDEQAALMRALNKSSVRVLVLSEHWNHPHQKETQIVSKGAEVIYHAYGRGAARENAPVAERMEK